MKQGVSISVRTNGCFIIHENLPGESVGNHCHPEHHIFIPLYDEIELGFDNEKWMIKPGMMAYLPPQIPHSFVSSAKLQGERLICFIDTQSWNSVSNFQCARALAPVNQLIKELLFYLLTKEDTEAAPYLTKTFIATLQEQLIVLGRMEKVFDFDYLLGKISDPRLATALRFIESHFAEPIKVEDISRSSGLGSRNLSRLFAKELGMSPKQIIMHLRIKKAVELLDTQQLSVTETAYQVGYNSLSQFIHAFRTVTGQLPSDHNKIRS